MAATKPRELSEETHMAVDKSLIGTPTGKSKITVERGPLSNFAKAVQDDNPIYQNPEAAKEAGFDNIPAPPTWGFAMAHWGAFREQQPDDPTKGRNPVMEVIGTLMQKGGMVLHGEQEFEYHRPVMVGDVLEGEGKVTDVYEKESKGKTMTFLVTENVFKDAKTGDPVLTTRMNLIHRG
jgi:acyl dehydratase